MRASRPGFPTLLAAIRAIRAIAAVPAIAAFSALTAVAALTTVTAVTALTAVTAVAATDAAAQQPTEVDVVVHLQDQRFRDRFGAAAPAVEAMMADSIAAALSEQVGFVRLVPGGGSPYVLVFALDRQDRQSTTRFPERGIWAALTVPGGGLPEFYWKTLRPAEAALAPVGRDVDLAAETARLFRGEIGAIQDSLLARIPISSDGLAWNSPLGWVLPFSRRDLCMKNQSRLAFVNDVPAGALRVERWDTAAVTSEFAIDPPVEPAHQRFLHRLFSEPVDGQHMDDRLRQALLQGSAKVTAVYVIEYRPEFGCRSEPTPPAVPGGGDR